MEPDHDSSEIHHMAEHREKDRRVEKDAEVDCAHHFDESLW